ncbi:amino acid ABC transporter substrate-binding protein [Hahella sp. CCB-MM4]|uniref:substrate-binding periplasmic protein n=1 Tax=Hahella sp. (strain CCB-MM4) TaxID=1926491 RepID=UPI000B9B90C8|nr:transporter substrate-binding domain-containing protein [Hahella sp. CCB-MM4]OZG72429.1 amino acid ABC transporter substrate-binding protein [Hahella sp. CCB-MM4]
MNMRAPVFYIVSICMVLLFNAGISYSDAEDEITLVTADYPPYEIETPQDGLVGYDVEVVQEAFRRAGIKANVIFIPWKRAVRQLTEGQSLAGFSVGDSPERRDMCMLSDPISTITPVLAIRTNYGGPIPETLADTVTLRGIGINGYSYERELVDLGAPHQILNTDQQALLFLTRSRADVFYTIKESTQYLAKNMGLSEKIKYVGLKDRRAGYFHVCFSRSWPGYEEYLRVFNRELGRMRADGTYDSIHRKYQ